MALHAVASLLDALRHVPILPPGQLEEVSRDAARFTEARTLAQYLLERGWLTPYQANQLILERGPELLLGQYVLLERLGEGVRGQVFKARHRHMKRAVALKVIRKELLADTDAVQRFYLEIQAASQLDHPNVVHAYDAGPIGPTHMLAMEYVKGIDLARLVQRVGPLSVPRACAYAAQTALGLQHAFDRGLVHRDIKPGNLLVAHLPADDGTAPPDGDSSVEESAQNTGLYEWGHVKILDFGLARLHRFTDDPNRPLTHEGAMVGTPDFMAPEQAVDAHAVDIRADLYSLGCTLYFLLSGQPPFPGGSYIQKVDGHRWRQPEPLGKLRPELSPEVTAVVDRLMAKSPAERFQQPAEVAVTFASLMGVPIGGPPVPPSHLEEEWPAKPGDSATMAMPPLSPKPNLSRWRLVGTVAAAVGLVAFLIWAIRPGPKASAPHRPEAGTLAGELKRVISQLQAGSINPVEAWQDLEQLRRRYPDTAEAREAAEWLRRVRSPLDGIDPRRFPLDSIPPRFRPGELVAILGDPHWRQWNLSLQGVAYRPDGQVIATCAESGEIWIWNAQTGRLLARLDGHQGPINCLAYSSNGRWLASGGRDKTVRIWDTVNHRLLHQLNGHQEPVRSVAFSPDSRALVSGGRDKTARLWNILDGKPLRAWSGHSDHVMAVAMTPDGRYVATGCADGTVRLWAVDDSQQPRATLPSHPKKINALAFSPKGDLLASGSDEGQLRLWDMAAQKERWSRKQNKVRGLALTPDGRFVVACADKGVHRWNSASGAEEGKPISLAVSVNTMALSPDGKRLAAAAHQPAVLLIDLATGKLIEPSSGHKKAARAVFFAADGRSLFSGGLDRAIKRWDLVSTGESTVASGGDLRGVQALAFSPSDQLIAAAAWWDPLVQLLDLAGKSQGALAGHKGGVYAVAFAPDGKTAATVGADESLRLWDIPSGSERLRRAAVKGIGGVAFSPDGRVLAYSGPGNGVVIFNRWASWQVVGKGHSAAVEAVAFAPDGKTVASGSIDKTVRLWDVATGQELARLGQHDNRGISLLFTPDGSTLISSAWDGKVIFWKLTGQAKRQEWQLLGPVHGLALAADGRHLATANADGTVYVFRLAPAPSAP